jgi:predicted ATPase/class 3 adenylate cyclase
VSKRELPSGTVTFLFTDIEGSTKLLQELGDVAYSKAVAEHRQILRQAFDRRNGVEFDTQGDAVFVAFPTAPAAIEAAAAAQDGLADGPLRVRMGIHSGTPLVSGGDYFGVDVHRAARIAAVGHGGQVLVSAATAALVEPDELTDLGVHRLKDLSAPERIYQLGEGDYPPLKSLHQTNLPIPSTAFVGRERELREVRNLLSQDAIRLLTLTGAGGTGKTRLGLQAAAALAESYPDGIWWVPLTPLRDSQLVLATAGQVVGATNGLAEHVGDRSMLIFFDNFEHVVEAGPQLAELFASCPNLDVLVTSREPLHVSGEQEYSVPTLCRDDGVELFLARARAVKPDFQDDQAIAEICERLDDLPLAVELAAARVKALSSNQILERLEQRLPFLTGGPRDLPERQRALRATVDWSHELLSPEEQELFARFSVFSGGCTLQAAEEVAKADLDTLQSLVDKSLLRHSEERYWMLETIREYASERLDESGQAEELRRRHADYVLELAEEAEPQEWLASMDWLDLFEREQDNIRAALDCFESVGESERAVRLAGAVWLFWCLSNRHPEGERRLDRALSNYPHQTAARAKALVGAADMAGNAGEFVVLRSRAAEARTIYREVGDSRGIADADLFLGQAEAAERNLEGARDLFRESVDLFHEVGDELSELNARGRLARVLTDIGDLEQAQALLDEGLERARRLGDPLIESGMLMGLAGIAIEEGRAEDALTLMKESLLVAREVGNLLRIRIALGGLARALSMVGEVETAARLLSCSDALGREITGNLAWVSTRRRDETLASLREQLDEDVLNDAWEQGQAMTLDEGVELALSIPRDSSPR